MKETFEQITDLFARIGGDYAWALWALFIAIGIFISYNVVRAFKEETELDDDDQL